MVKILVIGLDGATWEYIKPVVDSDQAPTIKRLMKNGVWGNLESTIPPVTIPAWPSMFSGMNPGKIGTIDFKRRVGEKDFELVNSLTWKGRMIWDRVKSAKFLLLNIPFTYPPYEINGHVVAIDFAPKERYTFPKELEKEIEEVTNLKNRRTLEEVFREKVKLAKIYEEERAILDVAKYLLQKYSYDVAIIRFGIPDHISHATKKEVEIFKSIKVLDNLLKEILEIVNFQHLFLVSDHGIKKVRKKFCINVWFHNNGYLNLKFKGSMFNFLFPFIFPIVCKFNVIFNRIVNIWSRKLRKEIVLEMGGNKLLLDSIDVKGSLAFSVHSNSLELYPVYLFTSLKDEKVNGLVEKLQKLTHDSVRVVKQVYRKDEIYWGDRLNYLPDLIIESEYCILPTLMGKEFVNIESFTHSMDGIFLAYGEGIKKAVKMESAKIYDIAPTILHILGLPIPNDVDGRVLMEIFEQDSEFAKREPSYVDPSYWKKGDEKERIKTKIRELKSKGKI